MGNSGCKWDELEDPDELELTAAEVKAIKALKRVAQTWPKSLWLFSASGSLCVMKKKDGERVMCSDNRGGQAVDSAYVVDTINILNDGGDW